MASDASYIPRVVDGQVGDKLRSSPVVLVEGTRGCGKTTTSQRFAASEVMFDEDEAARGHAAQGTLPLATGPHPMLLDEWPLVPGLWDRVRRASDRLGQPGRFILSASLLALRAKVDTSVCGAPRALVVVTSTGQPFLRRDGIGVVPITALKP